MKSDGWKLFSRWHEAIAPVLSCQRQTQFPKLLMKALGSIVASDEPLLLIVLSGKQDPYLIYEYKPDQVEQEKYHEYLNAYYLLDPCYRAFKEKNFTGYYYFDDLAPDGFSGSEIYQSYFKKNYRDEIGFIFSLGNGGYASLCASRVQGAKFSKLEKDFYHSISPVVVELLTKHLECLEYGQDHKKLAKLERMELILDSYGSRVLSEKEYKVMQLILRGYSMKAMATILHRSIDTIKKHHRSLYDKLGVSTQRELIPKFIHILEDSLNAGEHFESDGLEVYLSKKVH